MDDNFVCPESEFWGSWSQRHDLARLAADQPLYVLAPAEHRRARLFVQRVALVNSGHAPIAAGDVVQGPLDHLGPHAEPLHAAGACSSQVVQAPRWDARAHLLVELALAFAPAADRAGAGGREHVTALDPGCGGDDLLRHRRQRDDVLSMVLGARTRNRPNAISAQLVAPHAGDLAQSAAAQ